MMRNSDPPKDSFHELILKTQDLMQHSYYLSNRICQICIEAVDELEMQGKNQGAGRKVVEDYLSKHLAIAKALIDLLEYEPDMEECHTLYGEK